MPLFPDAGCLREVIKKKNNNVNVKDNKNFKIVKVKVYQTLKSIVCNIKQNNNIYFICSRKA